MWENQPHIPALDPHIDESSRNVGDYSFGSRLGRGEFATVIECRRADDPATHACKMIHKEKVYSTSDIKKRLRSIRRINTEIEAMRLLNHENVCRLLATFHSETTVFLILSKGGTDLYDFMDSHPTSGLGFAADEELLRQIVRRSVLAIDHCHSRGVVHRDIKPENVLVGQDVSNLRRIDVQLCDFGLCGMVRNGDWQMLDFVGSPGFFAPEMLLSDRYSSRKVDLWSLGCVIIEMMVGHRAFDTLWMGSYSQKSMHDTSRFERLVQSSVADVLRMTDWPSPELKNLQTGLLQPDVETRFGLDELTAHPWLQIKAEERSTPSAPVRFAPAATPAAVPEIGSAVAQLALTTAPAVDSPTPLRSPVPSPIISAGGDLDQLSSSPATPSSKNTLLASATEPSMSAVMKHRQPKPLHEPTSPMPDGRRPPFEATPAASYRKKTFTRSSLATSASAPAGAKFLGAPARVDDGVTKPAAMAFPSTTPVDQNSSTSLLEVVSTSDCASTAATPMALPSTTPVDQNSSTAILDLEVVSTFGRASTAAKPSEEISLPRMAGAGGDKSVEALRTKVKGTVSLPPTLG